MPVSERRTPKLFRDPIHDVISYDLDAPLGRLMVRLIDTQPVQRLRHIRQLGLAFLVYHGAEHSRFSHSMGAAFVAGRMFDAIHRGERPTAELRMAVCAAALLHDLGHAPFSHALETTLRDVLRFEGDHEAFSRRLILWEGGPIHSVLSEVDAALPRLVADIIDHRTGAYVEPIIASQLDADRMDYLMRDGYMTGVQNYHYDAGRILEMLTHDEHGLVVGRRALQAVESYLLSRFHMYQQVYYHKTVRAAETMVGSIFRRVVDLLRDGDPTVLPDGAFGRLLAAAVAGQQPEIADYARFSDVHAWVAFDTWSRHRDPTLSRLCSGFSDRSMLKTVELPGEELDAFLTQSVDAVRELVRLAGYDPTYFSALDLAEDTPFRPYEPEPHVVDSKAVADAIRIHMGGGRIEPIEAVSHVAHALTSIRYRVFRFCVPADVRDDVEALVRSHRLHPLPEHAGVPA